MRQGMGSVLVATLAWLAMAGVLQAAPSVRVLETWPPGDPVTLPQQQNFYLRLAYQSDVPLHIWARPYFQGQEVDAGSNPSPVYPAGSGEALGWFFFFGPGVQVDEVRISAGDGGLDTPVVATWRGLVVGGDATGAAAAPAWVAPLQARATELIETAAGERASEPPSVGDTLLVSGFLLLFPLVGLLALLAPVWGLWRWRGGWRLAAALPAAVMAFVVLRIVVDTARDPTSHNLWPVEILTVGAVSLGLMLVLAIARRLSTAPGRAR